MSKHSKFKIHDPIYDDLFDIGNADCEAMRNAASDLCAIDNGQIVDCYRPSTLNSLESISNDLFS